MVSSGDIGQADGAVAYRSRFAIQCGAVDVQEGGKRKRQGVDAVHGRRHGERHRQVVVAQRIFPVGRDVEKSSDISS